MGVGNKLGFTIIEVMLFLAVTGLLVIAILGTAGTSINIQRYRDSVNTLKDYLQRQYVEVSNVRNQERVDDIACDSSANISLSGDVRSRGQGDCVIIGKVVIIDRSNIQTSTVVGFGESSLGNSDVEDLAGYELSLLPESLEELSLEWGTQIAWPREGLESRSPTTPKAITILILRSPLSGLNYTFTADGANNSIEDMVVAGDQVPGQAQRTLCIESDGLFNQGMAVFINSFASNSSSIETRTNDISGESSC